MNDCSLRFFCWEQQPQLGHGVEQICGGFWICVFLWRDVKVREGRLRLTLKNLTGNLPHTGQLLPETIFTPRMSWKKRHQVPFSLFVNHTRKTSTVICHHSQIFSGTQCAPSVNNQNYLCLLTCLGLWFRARVQSITEKWPFLYNPET